MPSPPSPDAVAAALDAYAYQELPGFPGRVNDRRAGVAVPLVWEPELVCVLTERVASLRDHGGEISFPGGKPEPGEELSATALRETHEELGVVPTRVFGRLSSIPVFTSRFRLEPWVVQLPETPAQPNPDEVASVLRFDIKEVLARSYIDAIAFDLFEVRHLSPVFPTSGRAMFGATAHAFMELLSVLAPLYDRRVPTLRPGRYTWEQVLDDVR